MTPEVFALLTVTATRGPGLGTGLALKLSSPMYWALTKYCVALGRREDRSTNATAARSTDGSCGSTGPAPPLKAKCIVPVGVPLPGDVTKTTPFRLPLSPNVIV